MPTVGSFGLKSIIVSMAPKKAAQRSARGSKGSAKAAVKKAIAASSSDAVGDVTGATVALSSEQFEREQEQAGDFDPEIRYKANRAIGRKLARFVGQGDVLKKARNAKGESIEYVVCKKYSAE